MYSPVFGTTTVRNKRPSLLSQYKFTVLTRASLWNGMRHNKRFILD